jgi:hypothetical protein
MSWPGFQISPLFCLDGMIRSVRRRPHRNASESENFWTELANRKEGAEWFVAAARLIFLTSSPRPCASCLPNMRSERVIDGTLLRGSLAVSTVEGTLICTDRPSMPSRAPLSSGRRLEHTSMPPKKSTGRKVRSGCLTCK